MTEQHDLTPKADVYTPTPWHFITTAEDSIGSHSNEIRIYGARHTSDWVADVGMLASKERIKNARLIAFAVNSYAKHCGPRAIACAEGDLLGEALAACKKLTDFLEKIGYREWSVYSVAQARAVLAKAGGK